MLRQRFIMVRKPKKCAQDFRFLIIFLAHSALAVVPGTVCCSLCLGRVGRFASAASSRFSQLVQIDRRQEGVAGGEHTADAEPVPDNLPEILRPAL